MEKKVDINMMNKIPICLTVDNRYNIPCATMIISLVKNSDTNTFYDFFIIHSGLTNDDIKKISSVKDKYINCDFTFILMKNKIPHEKVKKGAYDRNEVMYFRLFIPNIKELYKYDKVIYSDVDVVFNEDIFEIYKTNIDYYYLAALRDANIIYDEDFFEGNTFSDDYFITNLLVMNLKLMREDKITEKAIDFFDKNHETIKYYDQDILNELCHGNTAQRTMVKYLSPRYSIFSPLFYEREHSIFYPKFLNIYDKETLDDMMNNPTSIHFVGGVKPWNLVRPPELWLKYFKKTLYNK